MFDFQTMLNGSKAVLTSPSVSVFEEHEKNDLGAATIYTVIAAVINGILSAIALNMQGMGGSLVAGVIGGVIGTLISSYIYWGIVFLLGRAFQGTGEFGELAYNFSLFTVPLSILGSILALIPVVGGIISLVVGIYSLYLTYLAIQAGMNLPSNKALYVILILFAIVAVIICGIFALIAAMFTAAANMQ
jgi:hypothetical protein